MSILLWMADNIAVWRPFAVMALCTIVVTAGYLAALTWDD